MPANAHLNEYIPQRPEMPPRLDTDAASIAFGARVVPGQSTHSSTEAFVSMTPTSDWPVISGSVPNLAATLAPPASGRAGPSPLAQGASGPGARANGADGVRLSRPISYGFQGPVAPSTDEPSPVVHIGRYTYIRSDTDSFRASLIPDLSHHQKPPPQLEGGPPPSSARPHGFSLPHEFMFVLIISLSMLLMLAGIAQALVPAAIIGQSFPDTNPGTVAWYSAAYGLTSGTFVLPSGRLGDLYGHKRIFIIGWVFFGVWSLIAALAPYVQQAGLNGTIFFIFCRAMQGIGPALLVPNGQAMLGRAYKPGPRKNIVMCLFAACAPLGFVLGGVMASLFAVRASWPWAFWTTAAACIALAAISVIVLPRTEKTKKNDRESIWVQLDAIGMGFGVAGLILFNFAFNQAPIVSWSTPYTYFLLIIGIMFLAAFVYTETVAPHPLVPVSAMTSSSNFVLACTAAGWGSFAVWVFYAFAFIENLRGWSPLLASASFAPAPVTGLIASLLTGVLIPRIGPHGVMFISMCAFFVGAILLVTAPVDQNYWFNTFFAILIMPFGMDMSNPAATILLSNSVSKEHQGIAASLVVTTVNYSISLALGIAGTIESHTNSGGTDLLAGYRGAQYFGLGLAGMGILIATAFVFQSRMRKPSAPPPGPPALKA